ncbi:unnamed protein product [Diplocarpon coronariae]|uniref:NADPH-dependent FMN reductase n=1 Tax=Diplocarpon coronariae TaxID=2795749 RepID=A0A218Z6U2_9HELO|nr:NADPH-dependent FMN reductase [Marssonina coronariae]
MNPETAKDNSAAATAAAPVSSNVALRVIRSPRKDVLGSASGMPVVLSIISIGRFGRVADHVAEPTGSDTALPRPGNARKRRSKGRTRGRVRKRSDNASMLDAIGGGVVGSDECQDALCSRH